MKGLYDRDFTVLAPEEEQEKERIDAEENAARKTQFGRKNMFHYYPEAVRRYYASLFPNNFMDFMLLRDEKVLNAQCDGFEALLRDRSISELDIKRYIQNNKYYTSLHLFSATIPLVITKLFCLRSFRWEHSM